jgi:hypothetical protein
LNTNDIVQLERQIIGCRSSNIAPSRRRIFAILVIVGKVDKVVEFIQLGIEDGVLPLTFTGSGMTGEKLLSDTAGFPYEPQAIWGSKSASKFLMYQRIVHVPFFRLSGPKVYFYELQPSSILPFQEYSHVSSGGHGTIRKAVIHNTHFGRRDSNKGVRNHAVFSLRYPGFSYQLYRDHCPWQ